MTQPAQDPVGGLDAHAGAAETAAAIARLTEQIISLNAMLEALDRLTDAKFVTYRTLIDAQAEKVALALASADKAVSKAESATERRFEGVNEFRAQLSDQAARLMPRAEADSLVQQLTTRIRELADNGNTYMTRIEATSLSDRNSERIQELTDRINRSEGQNKGAQDNKAGIYVALGLAVTVIIAVVAIVNILTR